MVKRKPAASGSTEQQSKEQRQKLGRLGSNKISRARLVRYTKAVALFTAWLLDSCCRDAESWDELDVQACFWLEYLWHEGKKKSVAADSLSGIQHLLQSKRRLPGAWSLWSVWQKLEPAQQAPPLPVVLLLALCDLAREQKLPELVVYLLVTFHAYLRPLELLQVCGFDLWFGKNGRRGSITLMQTKTSGKKGPETVVLEDASVIWWIQQLYRSGAAKLLSLSPQQLRTWFTAALRQLQIEEPFMLYSLRRGGATADFLAHQSVERCMLRGRWRDIRTLTLYLKAPEALRMAGEATMNAEVVRRAAHFQATSCVLQHSG